MPADA